MPTMCQAYFCIGAHTKEKNKTLPLAWRQSQSSERNVNSL